MPIANPTPSPIFAPVPNPAVPAPAALPGEAVAVGWDEVDEVETPDDGVTGIADELGRVCTDEEDENIAEVVPDGTFGGDIDPRSGKVFATAPARGVHATGNNCEQKSCTSEPYAELYKTMSRMHIVSATEGDRPGLQRCRTRLPMLEDWPCSLVLWRSLLQSTTARKRYRR